MPPPTSIASISRHLHSRLSERMPGGVRRRARAGFDHLGGVPARIRYDNRRRPRDPNGRRPPRPRQTLDDARHLLCVPRRDRPNRSRGSRVPRRRRLTIENCLVSSGCNRLGFVPVRKRGADAARRSAGYGYSRTRASTATVLGRRGVAGRGSVVVDHVATTCALRPTRLARRSHLRGFVGRTEREDLNVIDAQARERAERSRSRSHVDKPASHLLEHLYGDRGVVAQERLE